MKLYHFTSMFNLQKILKDGYIKRSPSNLLKPINPHWEIVNGKNTFADETDKYKPVVWLTDQLDFMSFLEDGLQKAKSEVAIEIKYADKPLFQNWDEWSKKNKMNKTWKQSLIDHHGHNYKHWYICEKDIKIDNRNIGIIYRPDILEKIMKDLTPAEIEEIKKIQESAEEQNKK